MVTLKDFTGSSEHLKGLRKLTIKKQIDTANYIKQISAQAGINLDDIDILKLFSNGKRRTLITDRFSINKIIFEYARKNKPEEPSPEMLMAGIIYREQFIKDSLKKSQAIAQARILKNLKKANTDLSKATGNNSRKRAGAEYRVRKWTRELDRVSSQISPDAIFNHLINIARNKFWKFLNIKDNCITWTNVRPIILTEYIERAQLSIRQDIGYVVVKMRLSDCNISVHPHKDNTMVDDRFHPYIPGGGGEVCWGNTYDFAHNAMKVKNISGLMAVTASVLSTYSSQGGPYIHLADLNRRGTKEHNWKSEYIDPDDHIKALLSEETTRQNIVNVMADEIADSRDNDDYDDDDDDYEPYEPSHCGDSECAECNEEYGDIF